jgi:hypothetical protein
MGYLLVHDELRSGSLAQAEVGQDVSEQPTSIWSGLG